MPLSPNQKLGLAIGGAISVAALGVAYLLHTKKAEAAEKKPDDATPPNPATPDGGNGSDVPAPPAPEPVEPIYSMVPAAALHFDALPMAQKEHQLMLVADLSAADQSALLAGIRGAALNAFGASVEHGIINGPIAFSTLEDMSTNFANGHGTASDLLVVFMPQGPANDMAIVNDMDMMQGGGGSGAATAAQRVALLKEYLTQLRKAAPNQRILWVLSATTEAAIAKALNESHEEWIRAGADALLGDVAGRVAQAHTAEEVQAILSNPTTAHPLRCPSRPRRRRSSASASQRRSSASRTRCSRSPRPRPWTAPRRRSRSPRRPRPRRASLSSSSPSTRPSPRSRFTTMRCRCSTPTGPWACSSPMAS